MSLSRFKASLVGAVIADCMGAIFEGIPTVRFEAVLEESAVKLERYRQAQRKNGTRPADVYGFSFTDDTAMARSVAASLVEKKRFDAADMAKRFSEEYFKEPDRGYGQSVVTVFEELRKQEVAADVYAPAGAQFGGSGSYGNGGAMRIAPAALFAFATKKTTAEIQDVASSITRLTHTHIHGVHGAVLLTFAINQCLKLKDEHELQADSFINSLVAVMKPMEEEHNKSQLTDSNNTTDTSEEEKKAQTQRKLDSHPTPYSAKLERVKEFLRQEEIVTKEVVNELGHDVSALGSVPTAILAFLRAATKGVPEVQERNVFEQTVLYAISLGGDTDTIATMAAAMCGALYGMENIPEPWQYYCEGVAEAETMAEKLFAFSGEVS